MSRLEPSQALRELLAGNQRFANGKLVHPAQTTGRRDELVSGQEPFAVIIGCSDSRVPPEVIFDRGLGDLFVIRVAGEVLDEVALGSVEYAVEHLGVSLVVVLGHSQCGAVAAAVSGRYTPGHLGTLLAALRPAVAEAQGQPGDLIDNAVNANVARVVRQLQASALVLTSQGTTSGPQIVGAYYDLATGLVQALP